MDAGRRVKKKKYNKTILGQGLLKGLKEAEALNVRTISEFVVPRTTGDILLKMEPLILKLVDQGLQHGDILGLLHVYLMIHAPGCREEYEDGTHPEYYYGPQRRVDLRE